MTATLLSVRGLRKRFGGLIATDGVDLDVRDGEIHFHFASMDVLRGYTEAEWNALLDEFRD